jgi:hypothetical protein
MKLISIMSLRDERQAVRDLLASHEVKIYSETEILGHATDSIARYGWFATPKNVPEYSALYFAIVTDEEADAVFAEVAELSRANEGDHPVRAFLVPVEKMV